MKIKYLSRLADLVVDIDENKYITDADIVSITDRGIRLIRRMKLLGLDIGALSKIVMIII